MQVLRFTATDFLFHNFPARDEGGLTRLRDALVNNTVLADVAATCGMFDLILYSDVSWSGRGRSGVLADCFEAFLGALFLDQQPRGLEAARLFAHMNLFTRAEAIALEGRHMDPKRQLQARTRLYSATSRYTVPVMCTVVAAPYVLNRTCAFDLSTMLQNHWTS